MISINIVLESKAYCQHILERIIMPSTSKDEPPNKLKKVVTEIKCIMIHFTLKKYSKNLMYKNISWYRYVYI